MCVCVSAPHVEALHVGAVFVEALGAVFVEALGAVFAVVVG